MGKRVPRTHAGGTWTKAQYFSFIRGALRQAARRYPVKHQVLDSVKQRVEGKRHRFEYQCALCKQAFQRKKVEVDHIKPAGSLNEYDDLPGFVERLYCEPDDLQVLCIPCHRDKTKVERAIARREKMKDD
jgi:5-methylcytosine-specific restriction endonuclease McrA